jgi:hypothetical protein
MSLKVIDVLTFLGYRCPETYHLTLKGDGFKALCRNTHERWDPGKIPVGISDFAMAEVYRQEQNCLIYINSLLIPRQQPTTGKGVT